MKLLNIIDSSRIRAAKNANAGAGLSIEPASDIIGATIKGRVTEFRPSVGLSLSTTSLSRFVPISSSTVVPTTAAIFSRFF